MLCRTVSLTTIGCSERRWIHPARLAIAYPSNTTVTENENDDHDEPMTRHDDLRRAGLMNGNEESCMGLQSTTEADGVMQYLRRDEVSMAPKFARDDDDEA